MGKKMMNAKPREEKNCIGSLLEAVQMSSLRTEFLEEFFLSSPWQLKKFYVALLASVFAFRMSKAKVDLYYTTNLRKKKVCKSLETQFCYSPKIRLDCMQCNPVKATW